MRHDFEKILGEELRFLAITTRDRLNLTQSEMGKRLWMSESSYSDIETGHSVCASALTEALLLDMQEDPKIFLHTVVKRFSEFYEREFQPQI